MHLMQPRETVLPLLIVLAVMASGCASQQEAMSSTVESPQLNAQSSVPLPPVPSEQQRRVETILRKLDSELEGLLSLLPPPTTNTSEPKR